MTTKPLKSLLESASSPLSRLAERASAMLSLRDTVIAGIDDDAAGHIRDVNLTEDNVLVVIVNSAAWAARLRFHSDAMLTAARRHGIQATRCQVRVRPAQAGIGEP